MKISSIIDIEEKLKIIMALNTDNWAPTNPIQDLYTSSTSDAKAAMVRLIVLEMWNYSKPKTLQFGPDYYIPPDFLIYVLVCTAQTTKSMKTNDIPLKNPIKLQQEMQKNFEFSQICLIFRAFFEKIMYLENGRGRH